MATIDDVLTLARAYCAHADLPLKTLSHRVFDDGKKLDALIEGRTDLTLARYDKTMQWFSDNWPDGLAWPDGIGRPDPVIGAEAGADAA